MRDGVPGMEAAARAASEQRGNSDLRDVSWDRTVLEPGVGKLISSSEEDEGLRHSGLWS